jgi:hypothetical protein
MLPTACTPQAGSAQTLEADIRRSSDKDRSRCRLYEEKITDLRALGGGLAPVMVVDQEK